MLVFTHWEKLDHQVGTSAQDLFTPLMLTTEEQLRQTERAGRTDMTEYLLCVRNCFQGYVLIFT